MKNEKTVDNIGENDLIKGNELTNLKSKYEQI